MTILRPRRPGALGGPQPGTPLHSVWGSQATTWYVFISRPRREHIARSQETPCPVLPSPEPGLNQDAHRLPLPVGRLFKATAQGLSRLWGSHSNTLPPSGAGPCPSLWRPEGLRIHQQPVPQRPRKHQLVSKFLFTFSHYQFPLRLFSPCSVFPEM